jgi:hypothetical protein
MRRVITYATVSAFCLLTAGAAFGQTNAAAPPADGNSDHIDMVGHLGIGYLGRRTVLIAAPGGGVADPTPVDAPVLGVRYWLSPMLGIDAGLGLSLTGGSVTAPGGDDADKVGSTVVILHGGVPLSLASSNHFSFQIVPEINFGLASATQELDPAPDNELSGFHFDIGARAGAEIHFGFIDIPQLSLQAGVGVAFAYDSVSASNPDGADPAEETKDSTKTFGTTLAGNPWDIFAGNIAALYYF